MSRHRAILTAATGLLAIMLLFATYAQPVAATETEATPVPGIRDLPHDVNFGLDVTVRARDGLYGYSRAVLVTWTPSENDPSLCVPAYYYFIFYNMPWDGASPKPHGMYAGLPEVKHPLHVHRKDYIYAHDEKGYRRGRPINDLSFRQIAYVPNYYLMADRKADIYVPDQYTIHNSRIDHDNVNALSRILSLSGYDADSEPYDLLERAFNVAIYDPVPGDTYHLYIYGVDQKVANNPYDTRNIDLGGLARVEWYCSWYHASFTLDASTDAYLGAPASPLLPDTNTPLPTATHTPPAMAIPLPTATHTPLPTIIGQAVQYGGDTGTMKFEPAGAPTSTPELHIELPTATHPPLPTSTPEPLPTATPEPIGPVGQVVETGNTPTGAPELQSELPATPHVTRDYPPAPVRKLAVTPAGTHATVTWGKPRADKPRRCLTADPPQYRYTVINKATGEAVEHITGARVADITGLTAGTRYAVRVRSYSTECDNWSNPQRVIWTQP